MGTGPVLVMPPGGLTHLDWYMGDTEAHERFSNRLALHRTLVLYDRHGCGLSDRNRKDFSAEDDMLDIEAVVNAVDAPQIDLFGISWGGSPCLAYAARHPDRVRRMVLYGTYSQGRTGPNEQQAARLSAIEALRKADPDLYLKTQASIYFPSGTTRETFQSLVRMMRNSTTPEIADELAKVRFDTQSLLPGIHTPTLVLHRRGDQACYFEYGRYLARRLPNARFLPLEGDAHFPWVDDADSVLNPTIEFLTEGQTIKTRAGTHEPPSGTAIILFADIVDSTALTERLGDTAFRDKARGLDEAMRAAIRANGGTAVEGKTLGDGVLAVFTSAKQAIACAQACHDAAGAAGLSLHAGIHAGDVIREADNVYGGAVNIAARVAAASAAGETLVSGTVRELARTSAGVSFEDRGEQALKGIDDPVRVWAVVVSGQAEA
jgi:class 3 adenylate cyclase